MKKLMEEGLRCGLNKEERESTTVGEAFGPKEEEDEGEE